MHVFIFPILSTILANKILGEITASLSVDILDWSGFIIAAALSNNSSSIQSLLRPVLAIPTYLAALTSYSALAQSTITFTKEYSWSTTCLNQRIPNTYYFPSYLAWSWSLIRLCFWVAPVNPHNELLKFIILAWLHISMGENHMNLKIVGFPFYLGINNLAELFVGF